MACSDGSVAPPGGAAPAVEAPAPPAAPAPEPAEDAAEDEEGPTLSEAELSPVLSDEQHALAARHILIPYRGATSASTSRSYEEARALAEETWRELQGGADFIALARERSSDQSNAQRGGFLGAFSPGTMTPAFETALLGLAVGETSPPVETPFGFHIIRREAVRERRVSHLFVQRAATDRTALPRTPEQAHARAAEARARLISGQPFEAVARLYSDGPSAAWGGDLGWIQQGLLPPLLDEPLFALSPGQSSDVIDSPLGSHVFYCFE